MKPAQSSKDLIDLVNLDGWTVDLLACRRAGFSGGFNSRIGVGPIETVGQYGPSVGLDQMMWSTAAHFATGYSLNGYAYVSSIWEIAIGPALNTALVAWLNATRARWPTAELITHGEAGERWRAAHPAGNDEKLRFVTIGSGIGGSDADKEAHWYFSREFRLVLLRNLTQAMPGAVVDFTRYDLLAEEPTGSFTRSWNLMNVLNMKGTRPQDQPTHIQEMGSEEKMLIGKYFPELIANNPPG